MITPPVGKVYSGVVSEIKLLKKSPDNILIQPYQLTLKIINRTDNYYQILMSYKKKETDPETREYGILYVMDDGIVKGQDTNGIIDGKLTPERLDLYYRSFSTTSSITS